jgi:hypothetical protein
LKKTRGIFFILLITTLISSFIFQACQKPEATDGAEFLPDEDMLNAFQTDSFQLGVKTTFEEDVTTDELSLALVGYQSDPVFGETFCKAYTQFRLSALTPEFPSNMEIDSVVLALAYNSAYYGTPGQQYFSIHTLSESLIKDSTYLSTREVAINTEDIVKDGAQWVKIDTKNPAVVGGDTTVPQLRIPLDVSFGEMLTHPSDVTVLDSQDAFLSYFKGVCIEARGRYDAVMRYDLIDPTSKITVYYRDLSGTTPDTMLYDFVVNTDCARYNSFKHRYTQSPLSEVVNGPVDGSQAFYVQSGGGLKSIISLPTIMDLKKGNRVINRAELVIPVEDDPSFTKFDVLYLRYENEEGDLKVLPDEIAQTIGGLYNATTKKYRFNITRYVQSLMTEEIAPSSLHLIGGTTGVSVKRIVAHGPEYNSANPSENMRLIVTFAE